MTNNHIQRCSTWLIIREMQNQYYIEIRFTLTRITKNKKTNQNKCWQGHKKMKLCALLWDCQMVQPLWKTVCQFLKMFKI